MSQDSRFGWSTAGATDFRVPKHVTRSRLGGKLLFRPQQQHENFKDNILWTKFCALRSITFIRLRWQVFHEFASKKVGCVCCLQAALSRHLSNCPP
jgi:hypothetical protein